MGNRPDIRLPRSASASAIISVVLALVLGAAPAGAVGGFGDVPADEFYAAPVQWMVENGITGGTSPGCFSPDDTATRAQAATFLHRSLGEPAGGGEPFADVGPGDWYADAVGWMVNSGVTSGTSPTTFSPDRPVTRGEMATFMHRAAGLPAAESEPFDDVDPSDFFGTAVAWMVETGVTTGTSPTTFDPHRMLTRAEIATFLYRVAGEPSVEVSPDGVCDPTGVGAELAAAEHRSWVLLNELRSGMGLSSTTRFEVMDAFARDWSEEMDDSDDFRHSSGPWAENIAWWSAGWATPTEAAERMHEMWVNSPGHFANMTRVHHDEVGIGFWLSDNGWHATHVFR